MYKILTLAGLVPRYLYLSTALHLKAASRCASFYSSESQNISRKSAGIARPRLQAISALITVWKNLTTCIIVCSCLNRKQKEISTVRTTFMLSKAYDFCVPSGVPGSRVSWMPVDCARARTGWTCDRIPCLARKFLPFV